MIERYAVGSATIAGLDHHAGDAQGIRGELSHPESPALAVGVFVRKTDGEIALELPFVHAATVVADRQTHQPPLGVERNVRFDALRTGVGGVLNQLTDAKKGFRKLLRKGIE